MGRCHDFDWAGTYATAWYWRGENTKRYSDWDKVSTEVAAFCALDNWRKFSHEKDLSFFDFALIQVQEAPCSRQLLTVCTF